jgi:molybdopterin molybdotransferase
MGGRSFDAALQWIGLPTLRPVPAAGDRDSFLCGAREASSVRLLTRREASAQMLLAHADLLVERRAAAACAVAGQPLRCLSF